MNNRLLFCLLLGVCLFACGPEPTTSDSTTSETSTADEALHLQVAMRVEPNGLNPFLTTQSAARQVRELIFHSLTSLDPQTFEEVPLLASIPDVQREPGGGVSYSYLINDQATWPNGLPVTAADVIFSLKAVMNPLVPAGAYRTYYYNIDNIITSPNNERRFRIVTKQPYLLAQQALGSLVVYPEYAYDPDHLLRNVRVTDLTDEKTAERLAESSEDLKKFAESFNDVSIALSVS